MNLLASLRRPEYIFRPTQIVRRLMCEIWPSTTVYETVNLPWGLPIRVQSGETVGSGIKRLGVHELPSSECILRLIDPGELVVDVGANIGYMTSIMAVRTGRNGEVVAFEPHPVLFEELQHNIDCWRLNDRIGRIVAMNHAVSSNVGVAQLAVPKEFEENHGISSLAFDVAPGSEMKLFGVEVATLDSVLGEDRQIGLLKIDVEGHELEVLMGAQGLLVSGHIRDILFEEHRALPTPVTDLLEGHGYAIFRIDGRFLGPVTASTKTSYTPVIVFDSPNYLATLDPDRMLSRMSKRGWQVYSHEWSRS